MKQTSEAKAVYASNRDYDNALAALQAGTDPERYLDGLKAAVHDEVERLSLLFLGPEPQGK